MPTDHFSIFALKLARVLGVFTLLSLSACTSTGFTPGDGSTSASAAPTPPADKIGTGGQIIGLIVGDELDNLSGGMSNSAYLAGRLAVQSLKDGEVTLIIRRYESEESYLKKVATEFVAAQAGIIIGPDENEGVAVLARLLKGQDIPIISLARGADADLGVYAAGMSYSREVDIAAAEMKKRKYGAIVIAHTNGLASRTYASALFAAMGKHSIKATQIDIGASGDGLAAIQKFTSSNNVAPTAIVFATSAQRAGEVISALQEKVLFAEAAVVGNSGWSVAPQSIPQIKGAWYAAPAGNHLTDFSAKFATINGQSPTLRGAIVYDLIVMAGVLPKVVPEGPYDRDVLTNDQGFKGQTGPFSFGDDGLIRRNFVITQID